MLSSVAAPQSQPAAAVAVAEVLLLASQPLSALAVHSITAVSVQTSSCPLYRLSVRIGRP